MPALSSAPPQPIKLILIGDSSSGKTGSLASLASVGYNLRILDLDNGLDILKSVLTDPKSPYDKSAVERVHYKTITETMRIMGGSLLPASATVWPSLLKTLDKWTEPEAEGQPAINFGPVTSWGLDDILVIDSLTAAANAALIFNAGMNQRIGKNDYRDIGAAQTNISYLLQLLTGSSVKCHIVVISHINYVDDSGAPTLVDDKGNALDKPQLGYPNAVGKALSPLIPRYFNSMLLAKTEGSGSATRHMLYTKPLGIVGAKSSAPLSTPNSYPLATGLADYFKAVRGGRSLAGSA